MPDPQNSARVPFDLATGTDFLTALPLASPALAEQKLSEFLENLVSSPPDPGTMIALLEQARLPLAFVGDELAKRFANRALELGEEEESCFRKMLALWRRTASAYAFCARHQEPVEDNAQYSAMLATVLHRCLYYTGCIIFDHFRARREIPSGLWGDLNGYFDTAEQWGLATTPVSDPLDERGQTTHCTAAYVAVLLVDLAGPYNCSGRDLITIIRWSGMWAPLVGIAAIEEEYELPPYVVELLKDQPVHPPGGVPGADARRLDTGRLSDQMAHVAAQLRQQLNPSQLGLGEETAGTVTRLLGKLGRPWSQAAAPRRFRRFASEGEAKVASSIEAIHYFVGGRVFAQADTARVYGRGSFDEIFTFRERAMPGQDLAIKSNVDYLADEWMVVNHSANGFRLRRGAAGRRITHSQLVGVCPDDGEQYLLGQVTWLMQEGSGGLVAGIAVLPGLPVAVSARHLPADGGEPGRYFRAFLLPPVAAIGEEASLVIPAASYRASGVLDINVEDGTLRVRMLHVRQRGVDFERTTYEVIDAGD